MFIFLFLILDQRRLVLVQFLYLVQVLEEESLPTPSTQTGFFSLIKVFHNGVVFLKLHFTIAIVSFDSLSPARIPLDLILNHQSLINWDRLAIYKSLFFYAVNKLNVVLEINIRLSASSSTFSISSYISTISNS